VRWFGSGVTLACMVGLRLIRWWLRLSLMVESFLIFMDGLMWCFGCIDFFWVVVGCCFGCCVLMVGFCY